MANVLGISLGTRFIGIAVLKDRELINWKVLSFQAKWSDEKLKVIVRSITQLVEKNVIDSVAVKIPDDIPISTGFMQLVSGINVLFERKKIEVYYYSLTDLKRHYCKIDTAKKGSLVEYMLERYPDLIREHMKELQNQKPYYDKIFEAVAAARYVQDLTQKYR